MPLKSSLKINGRLKGTPKGRRNFMVYRELGGDPEARRGGDVPTPGGQPAAMTAGESGSFVGYASNGLEGLIGSPGFGVGGGDVAPGYPLKALLSTGGGDFYILVGGNFADEPLAGQRYQDYNATITINGVPYELWNSNNGFSGYSAELNVTSIIMSGFGVDFVVGQAYTLTYTPIIE